MFVNMRSYGSTWGRAHVSTLAVWAIGDTGSTLIPSSAHSCAATRVTPRMASLAADVAGTIRAPVIAVGNIRGELLDGGGSGIGHTGTPRVRSDRCCGERERQPLGRSRTFEYPSSRLSNRAYASAACCSGSCCETTNPGLARPAVIM